MKKSTLVFVALFGLFAGIVLGFLISPIKKGIEIGNNCGNTTVNNYGKDEDDVEENDVEENDEVSESFE